MINVKNDRMNLEDFVGFITNWNIKEMLELW